MNLRSQLRQTLFRDNKEEDISRYLDRELAKGTDAGGLGAGDEAKDNPDEVISKKGIDVYKDMRHDEQIKAALFVKKFARLSTGWSISPPNEPTPEEQEATSFIEHVVDRVGFNRTLKGVMTALDFGYSIGEKLYSIAEDGPFQGKIIIDKIKSKAPENYGFQVDEFDNLLGLKPEEMGTDSTLLPIEKFIIYSYNQEFENPYGNSDLRGAYNAWWMKHLFQKFMSIYFERFGIPTAKGTYPRFAGDEQKRTLLAALKGIQSKTTVSLPEGFNIDLLEVAKEKGDVWLQALEHLDGRICRSILIPGLLGFSSMKFGSYALGKTQFTVFVWVLNELGNEIADDVVNPQIIRPLCKYNYNIDRFPTFRFNNFTPDNIHQLLAIWGNFADKGLVAPLEEDEDFVRKLIGLPNRGDGTPITLKEYIGQDEPEEPEEEE